MSTTTTQLPRPLSPPEPEGMDKLRQIIRLNSRKLLEYDAMQGPFVLAECHRELLAFNQFLALILLHHSSLQARYTVHFMAHDAVAIAAKKARCAPGELSPSHGVDYFKEYCNVLAGNIAMDLAAANFTLAYSLPFAIQGYNDIFFPVNNDHFYDAFYLTSKSCKVGVSCDIEVTNMAGLDPITTIDMDRIEAKTLGGEFTFI